MRPVDLISSPEFRVEKTASGCKVSRKRGFGPERREMELPVHPDRVVEWVESPMGGPLIQDVFPELSVDEREFLQSGNTPEDWAKMFPPKEDE
jgi:hypothetical protein